MRLMTRSLTLCGALLLSLGFATPALAGGAGGGGTGGTAGVGGAGGAGGAGGMGMASCVDAGDTCQVCADEVCPTETEACCQATGCKDLIVCVIENCADDLQDFNCIAANCLAEVTAAGGIMGAGTAAAQTLGECMATPLQNPPAGACTDCVDAFGAAGGGGSTMMGAGGMMAGSGGAPGTGGMPGTGGSPATTSTGGNANDTEIDDGCGCHIVGTPTERNLAWAPLLGLAALAASRRRR